jgi:hypothetical protein
MHPLAWRCGSDHIDRLRIDIFFRLQLRSPAQLPENSSISAVPRLDVLTAVPLLGQGRPDRLYCRVCTALQAAFFPTELHTPYEPTLVQMLRPIICHSEFYSTLSSGRSPTFCLEMLDSPHSYTAPHLHMRGHTHSDCKVSVCDLARCWSESHCQHAHTDTETAWLSRVLFGTRMMLHPS